MFKNNKYKNLIISVAIIIAIVLIGFKLVDNIGYFGGILLKIIALSMPFIYGVVIAYVLSPLVKIFEVHMKIKRSYSIALTYAAFIGVVILISIYGIPAMVENIKSIVSDIPGYVNTMEKLMNEFIQREEIKNFINSVGINVNIYDYIDKLGQLIMTTLEGSINTIVNFSSFIFNSVLGLLVSIYVLIDKERLVVDSKKFITLLLKEKGANKVIEFVKTYNEMIGTYIGIKAIDSAIIGIIAFILLSIVGSQYALILALVVAITNMIPYFGPLIGEMIGFLINVFVSPTKGIIVFLTLFGLQMFDGWYLDPKLVGNKVGVRPFWIIYAVVIGGGFFGTAGMLLASPTAAVIKIYYGKLLEKRNVTIDVKGEVKEAVKEEREEKK